MAEAMLPEPRKEMRGMGEAKLEVRMMNAELGVQEGGF
jgi:hypothetical protein